MSRTSIRFSGRIGYTGINGEGQVEAEGTDRSVVTAVALVLGVCAGVLPGVLVGLLCFVLPHVPVWLAVGLPVTAWAATTGAVLYRMFHR
jgi:hypothetical protein